MKLTTSEKECLQAIVTRRIDGSKAFCDMLVEMHGITFPEASKALDTFIKVRAVKRDDYAGTWHVKHGAFLDRDVVLRACGKGQ